MKIRITIDVSEEDRRALAKQVRNDGSLASHGDVKRWVEALVTSTLQVIVSEEGVAP